MQKAIAIDFDGCLCTNEYPNTGLILWTCRQGKELEKPLPPAKGGDCILMQSTRTCLPGKSSSGTTPEKWGQTNTGMIGQ